MHTVHDHLPSFGVAEIYRAIEIRSHGPCPLVCVRFRVGPYIVRGDRLHNLDLPVQMVVLEPLLWSSTIR